MSRMYDGSMKYSVLLSLSILHALSGQREQKAISTNSFLRNECFFGIVRYERWKNRKAGDSGGAV
jgi:hypothetical protein